MSQSPITTHVLDTSIGRPAAGVAVVLERMVGEDCWDKLGEGTTNADGRIADLASPGSITAGRFRLIFAVDSYFQKAGVTSFYPRVTIEFQIAAAGEHYHVPLLLSPFGYSTYRGS